MAWNSITAPLLFRKRGDAGQFDARQKFERGAAAGRDVRNFGGDAGGLMAFSESPPPTR